MFHSISRLGCTASDDPAHLDFAVIHGFLTACYWSKGIPEATVRRAAANSITFGVYDDVTGAQLAYARVVTDRATFAYLCDVFVLDSQRGRGLSRLLMDTILSHPDLQGLRRWLLMTRDAHGLYSRYGFSPLKNPAAAMELHHPDIYNCAT